jgi:hypothetical protein
MSRHSIRTSKTSNIFGTDLKKVTERVEKDGHVYERESTGYSKKEAIDKNEQKPFRKKI